MAIDPQPADEHPPRRRRLRLSHIVAVAIIAVVCLFVLTVAGLVLWQRDPTPPPTLADLAAAESQWQRHGPAGYDLDLETTGKRNDHYHLEVRGGRPTACTVNGHQPKERRVWETWTVPRQLEYIREDMQRPVLPGSPPPLIRVEFDEETGMPRQYTYVSGGFKAGWKVRSFKSVP